MRTVKFVNGVPIVCKKGNKNSSNVSNCKLSTKIRHTNNPSRKRPQKRKEIPPVVNKCPNSSCIEVETKRNAMVKRTSIKLEPSAKNIKDDKKPVKTPIVPKNNQKRPLKKPTNHRHGITVIKSENVLQEDPAPTITADIERNSKDSKEPKESKECSTNNDDNKEEHVKEPIAESTQGIKIIIKDNTANNPTPPSGNKKDGEKAVNKNNSKNKMKTEKCDISKKEGHKFISKPIAAGPPKQKPADEPLNMDYYDPNKFREKKMVICTKASYQKLQKQRKINKIKKKIRRLNFQTLCLMDALNQRLVVDKSRSLRSKLIGFNEKTKLMNSKNCPKKPRPPMHYILREKIAKIDKEIKNINSYTPIWKYNLIPNLEKNKF
ncbi:unnamed protein product [Phyllotreta striolata]|uniref:Uncharacterized protein n=1 Tax=Phyllotreta striolata TaxID=444603 RepID=A0A9N9TFF2_PHYSR|nr:unnamed protein product [Phyllotreta striolata]